MLAENLLELFLDSIGLARLRVKFGKRQTKGTHAVTLKELLECACIFSKGHTLQNVGEGFCPKRITASWEAIEKTVLLAD
jgi:aryl carrier-like protein